MKKTTSQYKVSVTELENREDYYHVQLLAGSGTIDAVMERSSIRHIIEQLDGAIGTGLKQNGEE